MGDIRYTEKLIKLELYIISMLCNVKCPQIKQNKIEFFRYITLRSSVFRNLLFKSSFLKIYSLNKYRDQTMPSSDTA